MKKLSSIIALSLAAALTFGMTVSAAGSSTTTNNGQVVTSEALAADADKANAEAEEVKAEDGNKLVATAPTVAVAANAIDQALANIAGDAENLNDVQATVMDLKVVDDNNNQVDPAGVERQIPGYNVPAGKDVDVYHCDAAGNITNKVPSRVDGANLYARFSELSPIVIIAYDAKDDGDDDDDDDDTAAATTSTSVAATTGVAASPKTGETVPVAVLFAVASLGAAVVCSRKARYNK